jgi:uncharacterized protein (TIGR02099 family)
VKQFLKRLLKFASGLAAFIVILLAIAVGLFRLFLPRVPAYQEEIKAWASAAIGMQVEFSGMDARWSLSGPELAFHNAELIRHENGTRIVAADEVRVGVGFLRLLFEQALVVDRLVIRETAVNIRQLEDGSYQLQGIPLRELMGSGTRKTATPLTNVEIIGEDIELRFIRPGDERPHFFDIPTVNVSVDDNRIAADATIQLPGDLGSRLEVSAIQLLTLPDAERSWDILVDAEDIKLQGWSALSMGIRQFQSGVGDLELALAYANGRITTASANLNFVNVGLTSDDPFDVKGRVEIDASEYDWLIAVDDFVLSFADHKWPESSLRVEASVDDDGQIVMVDAGATYLRLDDLSHVEPWLDEKQKTMLRDFRPSGVIRNLEATVSEIDSDAPRFDISADLAEVGIADAGRRPGVRGFSGMLHANRAVGRLDIESTGLEIIAPEYLSEPVAISQAEGTVIWRNSGKQTTIMSDSIAISSDIFHSQSNVQLILNKDGSSPEIDLASSWSISDIAAAKRYIPQKVLQPKLYEWFQMALVSGSITHGTTTLNGPLDKFPFDGGEGRLLMQASVRNMTFKYHEEWPATTQSDMEVILDNARLYTTQNRSVSAGIPLVDAKVNIPDLRDPVLTIDSYAASTLAAIREFSVQSPIARIFGGQLDRVDVSGDASFTLELTVPLKKERVQEFEFVARIRSNNGTLAIEGFPPPITDLIGEVTIERESISSEGLGGRFLGEDVSIELTRSEDPEFSVIATALGTATASGIVNDLGMPLVGLVDGATPYQARILFPSGNSETPSPMTIQIDSDLFGLAFDLPEPVGKIADASLQTHSDIRFLSGGETIVAEGWAEDLLSWQLVFNKPEESWDLDRGVVAFGEEVTEPADTRGLHIRGSTSVVRLQDWLTLSSGGDKKTGAAERIRSIDLSIDDFFVLGQHLKGHHVRLDRSAQDWLLQFEGEDVAGSVMVPYDFGGDRTLVLDMARLRLPGDESESGFGTNIDPRTLPAIQLKAAEFAFGDRNLGAVEASLEKSEFGLEAVSIVSKDATYGITGTGRWVWDENDPLGSHSFITATLTSTDVEQTMTQLNYEPGISGKEMSMLFDLDWSGSPRADFFDVLDGDVQVRISDGQLQEVEPGAGRIFGLLSIVSLPRRLSLDFRDVFNKGFGFDTINGSFTIDDGDTLTCDLSLEGPAADIGIVGAADLANRTYDQTAIVSAKVGNTLPIVGAVVAGPQVAAALLIFSQIFKKPLQEVGQVYYAIQGSWDEPTVESTNSEAFVASGQMAGCLAN